MSKSKEAYMDMQQEQREAVLTPVSAPPRKSIYNIHGDYLRLMDEIESLDGEITDEIDKQLAINREELEDKAVNYGYLIRQLDFESQQIASEIERLSKISASKERVKTNLKTRISEAMLGFNVTKIQKNNLTLYFKKSEQLMIDEDAKVPERFFKQKLEIVLDKAGLKEAVKSEAIKVPGIFILEKQNLQIK